MEDKIVNKTKTYAYRLIEDAFYNRTEPEDGLGSLTNIVSDHHTWILKEWHARDEKFGQWLVEYVSQDETICFEIDSADGWAEYSYRIERRETGTEEWEYVGHIKFKRDDWG